MTLQQFIAWEAAVAVLCLVLLCRKVSIMSQSAARLVAAAKAVVAEVADLKAQVSTLTGEVARLTAEAGTSDADLDVVSAELEAAVVPATVPDPPIAPPAV